ncbi:hypothetical protein B0O80DRAFT_256513 [Mortierella sp. GBAus27b]|nr:hypothetical protein B0O80DRAFT_256513 [Mortierella sp. GBAus27b]
MAIQFWSVLLVLLPDRIASQRNRAKPQARHVPHLGQKWPQRALAPPCFTPQLLFPPCPSRSSIPFCSQGTSSRNPQTDVALLEERLCPLDTPHTCHRNQQLRSFLSIQSAIGSFGGVLSLVSSVLVLFFGAGRVAPFGLVQKWLLRSSTKAKIRKAYRNDHINDMDEKQGSLASSFQSSLEGEPQAHHHRELKVLERRVKELETVLRDLYLDMKLIDTDDEQDQVSTNTTEEV